MRVKSIKRERESALPPSLSSSLIPLFLSLSFPLSTKSICHPQFMSSCKKKDQEHVYVCVLMSTMTNTLSATLLRKDGINPENMKEGITAYDIACLWKWSVLHQRWCHVWSSKKISERIFISVRA